ncbi:MAG: HAE1 family hydrophobic/amphiphilic exporter-1 [Pseudohongiellaceae bacterium]
MRRLLDLVIDRPVATCMLLLSLMVMGSVAIFRLPIDFLPLMAEPEIDIEVAFPGSHPLETLREVAIPIEEELATIPDVARISTRANSSQATIEVNFNWDVALDLKRMEVREAVERARSQLPEGIGFIKVQSEISGPADGAMLQGRISAERDLSESWDLLDRRISRPLERIKGVASVSLYGVEQRQVHVELDLEALRSHGLRAEDVLSTIDSANLDMDLGSIRGDIVRYDVRSVSHFESLDEIRRLTLSSGLQVQDVATVEAREPRVAYGRHLDRRFAIGIDVFKEPSANTVETVDLIMARIAEIENDPALSGISLLVWENAGEQIRHALAGLRDAGIYGGILAVLVLYLFLRRVKTTLIAAVAIPFSLVVTCGGMDLLGSGFNVLTLLGLMLGVGMLVDNAVVVMENIHRLQEQGLSPRDAAKQGVRDVSMAVVASTATNNTLWSWQFTAETSEMTLMMKETALTICLAVFCSLIVSLTFIPLAAARLAPRPPGKAGFLARRVVPAYRRRLAWTLEHRMATLILLATLAATVAIPFADTEISGETTEQQVSVQINYQVHDPSVKEVLEGYVNQVEAVLSERQDELGFESMYSWYSENRGCMTRLYLPRNQASKDALSELRRKLEGNLPIISGVKLNVGDRDWWRRGRAGRRMVAVAITGEDPEFLQELASDVEALVQQIPQAVEVWGPTLQGQEELRILVDADRTNAVGLTPQIIAATVSNAFRGRRLRRFQTEGRELEMVVSLPEDVEQQGLSMLTDLPIAVPAVAGEAPSFVPLSSVARIEFARIPPQIRRTDRETTTSVSVQFDEAEVQTEEAQALVAAQMAQLTLPDGYRWTFGESWRDREESLSTMLEGVLVSLMVVLLLMAALFESLTQPIAILITLPFAFFGAFWALWLGGYELDMVAFIGLIILIGIVVNNGIVMVDHVNHLRAGGMPRVDALLTGCGDRLRPVLMTAITTIFGLVPLALAGTTVAGAYIDSLAVVVIGGLTTSTLFTLVALPVWYTTVEDVGAILLRLLPRTESRGRTRWPRGGVLVDVDDSGPT